MEKNKMDDQTKLIIGAAVLGTVAVVGSLIAYNRFLTKLLDVVAEQADELTAHILEEAKK